MNNIEAMKQVLGFLEHLTTHRWTLQDQTKAIELQRQAIEQAQKQEPVAWMHPDGRLWTFGRGFNKSTFTIPLYTSPPPRQPLTKIVPMAQQADKEGSPCPEFWNWLPRAYNFEGDGCFTKYNMEVAFLAGKQAQYAEQMELPEPRLTGTFSIRAGKFKCSGCTGSWANKEDAKQHSCKDYQ